jgi:hypothetical protein
MQEITSGELLAGIHAGGLPVACYEILVRLADSMAGTG